MSSKFAHYKGVLDRWKPETSYQEKVDERKKFFTNMSIEALSNIMHFFEKHKEIREMEISSINLEIESLSQLIVDKLESYDAQSVELDSGLKVRIDIKPYVSVLPTPEAAEQFEKWVNSPKILKLKTLNAQRRDAIIKEEMEEGHPLPAWCKVFLKVRAKITGGNNVEAASQG